MCKLRSVLLAAVAAVASEAAFAVTDYVWTGDGGDNKWSTAGNWEGGVAPNASDANIVVDNDTAVTIVLDGVKKANGFTLKGLAPVTLSAVDSTCYVTNDYSGNSNASFIKVTQADGVFNLEAHVHFPNRVDLHCEGAVHFRSAFSQGSHNLYPQCGKFYFEGDSVTRAVSVGVGYANNAKDKFCGLYFSDNAQFLVEKGFSMGTHVSSPNAEVVVDGDGVLLESNSSSTIGEAESSEKLQRIVLKRGTVNLMWPTFASKRPAEFVQEGGTFTCLGYGMLGKSVNSRGQVLLKGGKFISQGQITGASGTPVKIVLDGGSLEVKGDVQCDISVTANGGDLLSSNNSDKNRKTNSLYGTLDVAAGGTLKTGGAIPFSFERNITVDGEIELASGSLVLNAAGVRRTTTSDAPWKLTIRDGAIFDIAQPCSYFWHLPDVLTEGTGGLRLAGRNACFVHSFAHADGAATNVAERGCYFANTSTSPFPGMPKAASSWGLYYVGPYVWTGKGGDNKWSTAANWEGEVVPDATDRAKGVDLSAATTVELDAPANAGCFLFASAAPNPTLTIAGENELILVGYDSYATCFEAVPSAHVVFAAPLKSERYSNATYTQTSAFIGGATYEVRTSTMYGTSTSWAFCLGGRFVYNSTIAKLSQTTSYNLLSSGGGANVEPSEVVFGPEADIKFNYLFFDKQSFTANQKIVQDGATLSGKAVHVWRCAADFRSPSAYFLDSGLLTLSEKLGVGSNFSTATTFTRRQGGSFVMTGGTLTTPVIECEENQNYIHLNGGTVVLGADGFVKTEDTTGRTFTANDKPALNLGGVTIAPSAASVVGLDTVLTGEGGATVVAGEGLTFAADKAVSGTGTLIADGAVAFAGEIAGSPTIRARDGGTISFAAGATVTGCPTIEIPADGALDIAADTTVSAVRVTVGGAPLAEGAYAGRFGAGTLVVSSAMPDDSAWTGAAGDNAYFTADNWKSGTVPNGATAAADFGNAVFAEATTIAIGDNLTLKTLTAPGCAADLTLEIADGKKLSLVDAGEIVIAVGHTLTIDGTVELPTQANPRKKVSVKGGGKLVLKGAVVNASALTTFTAYTPRLIAREGSEIELRCTAAGGVQFYAATADAYAPVPSKVTVAEGADVVLCDIPSWYSVTGDLSRFGAFSVDGGRVTFAAGANFSRYMMGDLGESFETTIPLQTVTINGGEFVTPQGVRCLNPAVRGKNSFVLNGGVWRQTADAVMADADLCVKLAGDMTLDVPADVAFEADLTGTGAALTKTGVGQLALSGSAEGVTNLTVEAGAVSLGAAAAGTIPATATVRLAKTGATLDLDYEGTADVRELWIGGRQRAKGLYSSETAPQPKWTSYFTGIGSLLVAEGDLPGVLLLVR